MVTISREQAQSFTNRGYSAGQVASAMAGLGIGLGSASSGNTMYSGSGPSTSSAPKNNTTYRASTSGLKTSNTGLVPKANVSSNVGTFSSMNLYNQTVNNKKNKNGGMDGFGEEEENKTQQDLFGDIMYGDKKPVRTPYTGEGFQTTQGKYTKGVKISLPKELNVYGEAAKIAEQAAKGTISKRNDYIISNLFAEGAKTKDDIRGFLNAQQGFMGANTVDQQNTVEAIAARMGITKESITPQDMIAQQQDELLKNYQDEQGELILDADQQKAWKEFDAIGGTDPSKYPTPEEINTIATKYGLDPKKAQEAADAWKIAKDKSIEQQRWKEKDIGTDKDRNIEDAKTQLDRNREDINAKIDDTITQMERDVAGAEKVGALKGYSLSSGYIDGINNVKTDANKFVDRLHTALNNAEADTAKYITRIGQDYTTNMDRLKTSMTDQLMNNKMAGTAEVQALLTKYSPTDVLLTKELKRVNDEFGVKSQALYKSFLENFKGITDAAMYESEKLQEYTYKQRQLADLTIQNLMSNNGMALRSMSDSAIEDLYKAGYIGASDVVMLKNAKIGANQMYNDYLKEKGIDDGSDDTTYNKTIPVEFTPTDETTLKSKIDLLYQSNPLTAKNAECGTGVNDWLGTMGIPRVFTDPIDSKKAVTNSEQAKIGSVAVFDWSQSPSASDKQKKYGHVGIVTKVDANGNPIEIADWNWNSDGKYSKHAINANQQKAIKGYFDPTIGQAQGTEEISSGGAMKDTYLELVKRGGLTNSDKMDVAKLAAKQGWLGEYNEALKLGMKTELTPTQLKHRDGISADIENNAEYAKASDVGGQADTVIALMGDDLSRDGFNDVSLINAFQRIVDPGATVREGDVALLQSSLNLAQQLKVKMDKVVGEGQKLTPVNRKSMLDATVAIYNARAKYGNDIINKRYKPRAEAAGLDWDIMGYNLEEIQAPSYGDRGIVTGGGGTTMEGEGSILNFKSKYSD